jgi:hypothetical protein
LFPRAPQNSQLSTNTNSDTAGNHRPALSSATAEKPLATDEKTSPAVEKPIASPSVKLRAPIMGRLEMGINRNGHDIGRVFLPTAEECSNACLADSHCKAMTFVMDLEHPNSPGLCWLKDDVPPQESHPAMVSAIKLWP